VRLHRLIYGAIAVGALTTLAVGVVPSVRFAYRSPSLHILLEAVAGLVALLAAYLVFGRFRATRRASDLGLVCALGMFAAAGLALSAIPRAIDPGIGSFVTWAPLTARVLGAVLLAAAAYGSARRVSVRDGLVALAACALALGLIAGTVAAFADRLPQGIDPSLSPRNAPDLSGDPTVLALQLVTAALFCVAAIGFARNAGPAGDDFSRWLAAGAVLAAFARVNYFLFPSLYSDWVYLGDLLRLAFYLVVLVGAAREIGGYWRAAATAAILDERRRMARDLHDGLAQELAFIVTQAQRLARRDDPAARHVVDAARRALDESRRAIAALSLPLDEPFASLLARVAEDVGVRVGLRLDLHLEKKFDAPADTRDALLRVVREAVTNAAKHAQATSVRIELTNGDGFHLRISDDGRGFDPSESTSTGDRGFGLTSMRERIEALGGRLRVASAPGRGTEIDVVLP
jgi:signal transduction histidine kinase